MALADIQLRKRIEEAVMAALTGGRYPKLEVVRGHLLNWLKDHVPGRPTFKARLLARRQVSSSRDYNASFGEVAEDLASLYEEARELLGRLRASFAALLMQEEYLKSRLGSMLPQDSIGDSFVDYSRVDLEKTTAFVDLASHEVRLPDTKTSGARIDLSLAQPYFDILTPYVTYRTLSPLELILDDSENTYWLVEVSSPTPGEVASQLLLDLGDEVELNSVSVVFHGRKPQAALYVSRDGVDWQECPGRASDTWTFPPVAARWIKILMQKPHDAKKERYLYYFGIKHIAAYKVGYTDKAEIVSKSFEVSAPVVRKFALSLDADVPPLTSIECYVSFDGNLWVPLKDQLDLGTFEQKETVFSNTAFYSFVPGVDFYALMPAVNEDLWLPELYVGLEKYLKARTYLGGRDSSYVPSLADWEAVPPHRKTYSYKRKGSFLDTISYPNPVEQANQDNFFCYTFYIYSEEVRDKWVYFNLRDGYSFTLYLNGAQVPVAGSRAFLHLVPGWNEFIFLVYNFDPSKRSSMALTWDWDLSKEKVRARREPLELVDYPVLAYSTPPGSVSRYALAATAYGVYPVINFNPVDRGLSPADFLLVYKKPKTAVERIWFKAVLSRYPSAGQITPRLRKYEITVQ